MKKGLGSVLLPIGVIIAMSAALMAILGGGLEDKSRWYSQWPLWMLLAGCAWAFWQNLADLIRRHRAKKDADQTKAVVIGLFMLSVNLTPATGQIHQSGQTTLELSGGLVDGFKLPGRDNFGVFGGVAYSKYKSVNTYWKAGVHLNQKFYSYDKTFVPVSQWLVEGTYFTKVMGLINRSWIINAGAGIAGGYESINQDRGEVQGASLMNLSEWVVGPTLAIEGEYILTGRTILIARVQEYYLFRSNIIPTRFNVGVGVKFILDTDSSYK